MKIMQSLRMAAFLGVVSVPALAVTQSVTASSTDQYWYRNPGQFEIGRITLQYGTNEILDIDTSVRLVDQGWGYESPTENAVYVGLFSGDAELYQIRVAGASHAISTQTYDLAANATDYARLNAELDRLDWASYPNVTVRFYTTAVGYLGWELHTSNDSMMVSSVPEPSSYGMLLAGLGVLAVGAVRGRRAPR